MQETDYDTVELRINDEPVGRISLDLDSGKDPFDLEQKQKVANLPRQAAIDIIAESFLDHFMHDFMRDYFVEHNWIDYGANGDKIENEKLRKHNEERLQKLGEEYEIVDYELEYDLEVSEFIKKDNC